MDFVQNAIALCCCDDTDPSCHSGHILLNAAAAAECPKSGTKSMSIIKCILIW